MTGTADIIILGLGNILLQDEGFGVHFIRWFDARYILPVSAAALDGGTLGYFLLDTVTSCRNLIVIDVIKIDDRPGSVYRFTREQMETYLPAPTSAHEVEFFDVLCKADMMGACPEVTFLCAVPQQYSEMGMEMTPVMEQRFATVEGLLLERLAELNIYPERQLCA